MCLALNKWLKKHGLSQYAFAKRYRISQPYLNQLLSGKKSRPSLEKINYIAQITDGAVTLKDWPDAVVKEKK